MEKKFVMSYDGFLRRECPYTLEEAKVAWNKSVRNHLLYEFDCSIHELNADGSIKRRVDEDELRS